jgi:hypothetical protein
VAPQSARAIQWLSNTVLRATTESRSSTIGPINLDRKQAGKPSARNGHARFDAAGAENQLTIRLVRHSQGKRGATDRSNLRSSASVLDPTDGGDGGKVGIIRSPIRATVLRDCGGAIRDARAYRVRWSLTFCQTNRIEDIKRRWEVAPEAWWWIRSAHRIRRNLRKAMAVLAAESSSIEAVADALLSLASLSYG